jgi:hypothetical protein
VEVCFFPLSFLFFKSSIRVKAIAGPEANGRSAKKVGAKIGKQGGASGGSGPGKIPEVLGKGG